MELTGTSCMCSSEVQGSQHLFQETLDKLNTGADGQFGE